MNPLSAGLIIPSELWSQMEIDVASRFPEEACGLIAGEGNQAWIVIPIANILHDPHHFRLDPQEQLDAFLLADRRGWDILAVYHSHPDGISFPSPTDFVELTFPGIIYLIWYQEVSTWKCRAYLMESQLNSSEVPLIISTN